LTSDTSHESAALIEDRRPVASALGVSLAELMGEPEAFVTALRDGLAALADEGYATQLARLAPTTDGTLAVRAPLQDALLRCLRDPIADSSPDVVLWLAQRLATEPVREVRLFALPCLRRTLPSDPERSWQLLRRLARGAQDWVAVDAIAAVYAQGVLAERFRWAELEQLAYSDRSMERRLIGSTLARIPHELPRSRHGALDTRMALDLLDQLMGDADDQVQKALAWALREWSRVDRAMVGEWLDRQSVLVAATWDGHRAWVIRDALTRQPEAITGPIRARLAGVRRKAGAPSTSTATGIARQFGLAGLADQAIARQGERFTGRRG